MYAREKSAGFLPGARKMSRLPKALRSLLAVAIGLLLAMLISVIPFFVSIWWVAGTFGGRAGPVIEYTAVAVLWLLLSRWVYRRIDPGQWAAPADEQLVIQQ